MNPSDYFRVSSIESWLSSLSGNLEPAKIKYLHTVWRVYIYQFMRTHLERGYDAEKLFSKVDAFVSYYNTMVKPSYRMRKRMCWAISKYVTFLKENGMYNGSYVPVEPINNEIEIKDSESGPSKISIGFVRLARDLIKNKAKFSDSDLLIMKRVFKFRPPRETFEEIIGCDRKYYKRLQDRFTMKNYGVRMGYHSLLRMMYNLPAKMSFRNEVFWKLRRAVARSKEQKASKERERAFHYLMMTRIKHFKKNHYAKRKDSLKGRPRDSSPTYILA